MSELRLDEDTIVMFSSDNGPHLEGGADPDFFGSSGPLTGRKRDLYEGGIRVPMLVRWQGKIQAGSVTDHPSAFWDVLPTCAEIAETDIPSGIDGISFLPTLINRGQQKTHRHMYWEFHERGFTEQAVRMGKWKAIRHGPSQPLQLYDLSNDLSETGDVAATNPDVVKSIADYLNTARTPSELWPLKERGDR